MDEDRISQLPDFLVHKILSFLPTKEAVATSALSKKWQPMWRSVPTLDFECIREAKYCCGDWVHIFLNSRNDKPIKRFRFKGCSHRCYMNNVYKLITVEKLGGHLVQLDLSPGYTFSPLPLPSAVLSSNILEILKLSNFTVKDFSSINLPSLKVLYFRSVIIKQRLALEFLSGCPNLEDLDFMDVKDLTGSWEVEPNLERLSKLSRAVMDKPLIPYEMVCNVEFLHISRMNEVFKYKVLIPEFSNLTHLELEYNHRVKEWPEILTLLIHCPKLQHLSITLDIFDAISEGTGVRPYPDSVPECLSSQLRTCCVRNYFGTKDQLQFAEYMLKNARVLRKISFCTYPGTSVESKLQMLINLTFCTRLALRCKVYLDAYEC